MENIISQINKIRDINSNDKLVIFVGAGVSKNSGVCSWWELVKEIADKIGFNKCDSCNMKNLSCKECGESFELCSLNNFNCEMKYNFSSEDFLIIPQHYFDSLKSDTSKYYDFLIGKFRKNFIPNPIDEIIISLNPEHIITTNYDHLLEDVSHPNVSKYTIIKNDDDMLSKCGRHYIIKMHGDICEPYKMVLKEDDYLKYSQNHIIIESYIKSLLIDKTFLFVGYSLNDNNLKLIMSYIDYFVKEKKILERSPHYLVVNEIKNEERETLYWRNKGVELVDLSTINQTMLSRSSCESIKSIIGKQLYTFLNYIKNDKLPFTNDNEQQFIESLIKSKESLSCFKFISYKTLMELCGFKSYISLKTPLLTFNDVKEYEQFKIITENAEIKKLFAKARIYGAQLYAFKNNEQYLFSEDDFENDDLFVLSIQNRYTEIIDKLDECPASLEKAYYYSLIKYTDGLQEIMESVKKTIDTFDYNNLTSQQYYDLAVYEFNNICCRILNHEPNNFEQRERLRLIIDNAATKQSSAYKVINDFTDKNTDNSTIQKLNNILHNHEEYYMKKSTTIKMGGTIHGDLYKIQQEVYDYYLFYKMNHLMLDWFNNVENIVDPYIKAILCTYYPDEYQFSSNSLFGRTYTRPYPITYIDIDMIVKHVKLKNFQSWISYYKVFTIILDDKVDDIENLFENFCVSMRTYWNVNLVEQLEVFCLLLSLLELTKDKKQLILNAFIKLVTPDKNKYQTMLNNSLRAIWLFVQTHYDKNILEFRFLLKLLINKELIKSYTTGENYYLKLIKKLSDSADEEIYAICSDIINNAKNNREKCYFTFVYSDILLTFNFDEGVKWILDNISDCCPEEVFYYLENKIISYNDTVKNYFQNYFSMFDNLEIDGVHSYPNNKKDSINNLIILLLIGCINKIDDIQFLKHYAKENDYLKFLFYPDSFDFSKITTADYMWCNIMNNDTYRDIILQHKLEFWTKNDEKRISLGLGNHFENRIVYKYLLE
ncbi:MAG: SIR2 family protein [Oscillospiraceae bacterium]|nr:SIR2 family protein [Oscillospiraceae bacterium]